MGINHKTFTLVIAIVLVSGGFTFCYFNNDWFWWICGGLLMVGGGIAYDSYLEQ